MPDTSRGAERTKVLSVRFTAAEFDALSARATEIGVGPSTLARTFVRQALIALTADTRPTTPTTTAPTAPAVPPPTPDSTSSDAQASLLEARLQARLQARLEALLDADLVARVEALERRTPQD